MEEDKVTSFLEGLYPKEPCTHPRLVHWFSMRENAYEYVCTECLTALQMSAYELARMPRREWHTYLVERVTRDFGAVWGQKALEWLQQEEETIRDESSEPRQPA